jgi:hypothetical protein
MISPSVFNNRYYTGVGVLIITTFNNMPYMLLGNEKNKSIKYSEVLNKKINLYEEFGGGVQTNKISLEKNALLELREETANLINITDETMLLNCPFIDMPFLSDRIYRLYILVINDITPYLWAFNNNLKIIKSYDKRFCNMDKKKKIYSYMEMDNIQLIPLVDICNCINDNNILLFNDNNRIKTLLNLDDNIYINSRLTSVLQSYYDINGNGIRGIDMVINIYNNCVKFNNMNIMSNMCHVKRLRNNKNKNNDKYDFLNNTYSIVI